MDGTVPTHGEEHAAGPLPCDIKGDPGGRSPATGLVDRHAASEPRQQRLGAGPHPEGAACAAGGVEDDVEQEGPPDMTIPRTRIEACTASAIPG
jgi:hypothetical protein